MVLVLSALCGTATAQTTVPTAAWRWYRVIERNAEARFGLDAPMALFGAQVHQESRWNPKARSAYAEGLAQFTPQTSAWIARLYPEALKPAAPYSPQWALSALVAYDDFLLSRIKPYHASTMPRCSRWAMTLSAYNGGLGWLKRDRRLTASLGGDPDLWWNSVARHTRRSAAAERENRDYPRVILRRWQPAYRRAGWGGPDVCS